MHSLQLLARLDVMSSIGPPVLVGVSRKSLVGIISGRPAGSRDAASSALAALCALRGARILRAHDVAATVDALKVVTAFVQVAGEVR
jgi:dihydropteroate synthase